MKMRAFAQLYQKHPQKSNVRSLFGSSKNLKKVEPIISDHDILSTFEQEQMEIESHILKAVQDIDNKKSRFLINPENYFYTVWDYMGFLIIIYQSIVIPFRVSFDVEP